MQINGLYSYEMILLVLGVILFITLLVILIIFAAQRRSLKGLVAFFLLPLVMIGFPGIQKITYENGVLSIEKLTDTVAQHPDNVIAREKLKAAIAVSEKRPNSDPAIFLKFSKAQAVLGDTIKAITSAEQALRIAPHLLDAENLIHRYSTPRVRIERMAGELEKNPNDHVLRTQLAGELSHYSVSDTNNALSLTTAAQAHAVLKDTAKALELANSVLRRDHKNQLAVEIQRRMKPAH
jgi:tetratricopeptide (TPR) repeat protein